MLSAYQKKAMRVFRAAGKCPHGYAYYIGLHLGRQPLNEFHSWFFQPRLDPYESMYEWRLRHHIALLLSAELIKAGDFSLDQACDQPQR